MDLTDLKIMIFHSYVQLPQATPRFHQTGLDGKSTIEIGDVPSYKPPLRGAKTVQATVSFCPFGKYWFGPVTGIPSVIMKPVAKKG